MKSSRLNFLFFKISKSFKTILNLPPILQSYHPHIPTNPLLSSRIIVLFRALEERLKKVNITKSSRFFYFLQAKFK